MVGLKYLVVGVLCMTAVIGLVRIYNADYWEENGVQNDWTDLDESGDAAGSEVSRKPEPTVSVDPKTEKLPKSFTLTNVYGDGKTYTFKRQDLSEHLSGKISISTTNNEINFDIPEVMWPIYLWDGRSNHQSHRFSRIIFRGRFDWGQNWLWMLGTVLRSRPTSDRSPMDIEISPDGYFSGYKRSSAWTSTHQVVEIGFKDPDGHCLEIDGEIHW